MKDKIELLLRRNLEERANEYLKKLSNPLASEIDFLDKEIKDCISAIERCTELNNKYHHGQPSILEYERINWQTKLKIAEQYKAEFKHKKIELSSIFNKNNNSFKICKELMEDLDLTIDEKPNPDLKKGSSGKLIALISEIKSTPDMLNLDNPTEMQLLNYFNSYLNTTYKSFPKRSNKFREGKDISKRYIKNNFKK